MKFKAFILFFACAGALLHAQQMQPPMPPSPIAEFRGWLSQSPEERRVALAKRSETNRKVIEQKLQEYQTLPADERNRRLDATELQWYLTRLLKMPRAQRTPAVQRVPVPLQPFVIQRLKQWDQMSPELQQQALDHQAVVEYLSTPEHQQAAVAASLTKTEHDALALRIANWKRLPPQQRANLDERLSEFFSMRPEKQTQSLNDFSENERKSIEKTLLTFRQLTPTQRDICIRSFSAFANMKREEQIGFLKNAERWQAMPPRERAMWKKVVAIVPPMPELPAPKPPRPQ